MDSNLITLFGLADDLREISSLGEKVVRMTKLDLRKRKVPLLCVHLKTEAFRNEDIGSILKVLTTLGFEETQNGLSRGKKGRKQVSVQKRVFPVMSNIPKWSRRVDATVVLALDLNALEMAFFGKSYSDMRVANVVAPQSVAAIAAVEQRIRSRRTGALAITSPRKMDDDQARRLVRYYLPAALADWTIFYVDHAAALESIDDRIIVFASQPLPFPYDGAIILPDSDSLCYCSPLEIVLLSHSNAPDCNYGSSLSKWARKWRKFVNSCLERRRLETAVLEPDFIALRPLFSNARKLVFSSRAFNEKRFLVSLCLRRLVGPFFYRLVADLLLFYICRNEKEVPIQAAPCADKTCSNCCQSAVQMHLINLELSKNHLMRNPRLYQLIAKFPRGRDKNPRPFVGGPFAMGKDCLLSCAFQDFFLFPLLDSLALPSLIGLKPFLEDKEVFESTIPAPPQPCGCWANGTYPCSMCY